MTQDQQVVAFMYETDEERWLSFDQENPDCIDCDFKVIPLYATPKSSEGEAPDMIPVAGMLQWIEACWPTGSGSDFNQGVVRGFEIIRAQLQEGHIQEWIAKAGAAHD